MQRFGYRNPRYNVDVPVCLKLNDRVYVQRCRNISVDGLRVEMRGGLPLHAIGEISIEFADLEVSVQARVAYSGSGTVGLRFLPLAEHEREMILKLIGRLVGGVAHPETTSKSTGKPIILQKRMLPFPSR